MELWNAGKIELGTAAITATDRMITAGDVKYEPQQLKAAFVSRQAIILIAGDYSLHSQAIRDTQRQVSGNFNIAPINIATIYASAIQAIKQRQAEDLYLRPFGLNADSFLVQQKEMAREFVSEVTAQMQAYEGDDVEALVVASDGANVHLFHIDNRGTVRNLGDVGFGAIGIGAGHARSSLMQLGYVNTTTLAPALMATYRAKKRAEVAPGVGQFTDMQLVFKDATRPVWPDIFEQMEVLYDDYENRRFRLDEDSVASLWKAINERDGTPDAEEGSRSIEDTQAKGGDAQDATEASRPDERGEQSERGDKQGRG